MPFGFSRKKKTLNEATENTDHAPVAPDTVTDATENMATMPDKTPVDIELTIAAVISALKTIYDPEIPVNIYDLGLIYDVRVDESGHVDIDMTLTSPGCPVAQTFPGMVEAAINNQVEKINSVDVTLVWDPPWSIDTMTEAAKLQLGLL